MRLSETKANLALPRECPSCQKPWPWAKIGKITLRSGAIAHPYFCKSCGHKSQVCETKINVRRLLLAHNLPESCIKELPSVDMEQCEVCGELGAELHHYAPRHLFDDADHWATGYLCKYHHKLWHDTIRAHK